MPSKKEKQQQQALNNLKAQTTPLANSTNTTSTPLTNSYHSVTTNHYTTTTTKKTNLTNESSNGVDHLSLMRDQKHELDGLNNRFSTYVLALRQKSKENDDLQKKVDAEKQKKKSLDNRDSNDLEGQMDELRTDIDESAVLTEHFIRKRNRALKELAFLKEKIRNEEELSYTNRRQALETEHQQMLMQLKDLSRRFEDLEKNAQANKAEKNQMEDLYKKLEDELHDLVMNNMRLECNLRTIEEKILLTKAVYETEKNDLANEQIKQQQFYTVELDNAITDIKQDFQTLLKSNKVILENAYTERIEQVKTQISTYQASKPQETASTSRVSIETLHDELKQAEKARDKIENEYRPLVDLYVSKQKENTQIDEERVRLDGEYSRLLSEINQVTEAIEVGKQYWFSVHFELETYRRLLDLEATKVTVSSTSNNSSSNSNSNSNSISNSNNNSNNSTSVNHVTNTTATTSSIVNGKEESAVVVEEPRSIITVKKTESQRAISKTGKFDIDQVQAGFISINNAATNCVDQPLKGWTLVRSVNDGPESTFQFPDAYVLKARTRVRVYSNKADNPGTSAIVQGRLVASDIPTWASTGQGDNVKITLLDEKAVYRAQYSETWQ